MRPGAITRYELRNGNVTDVVTGLPSLATEEGRCSPSGRTICRCRDAGNLFFTIGFGGNPTAREDPVRARRREARPPRARDTGRRMASAEDLGQSEADNNPDGRRGRFESATASSRWRAGRSWPTRARTPCSRSAAMAHIAALATFADRLVDAPPFLGLPPGTRSRWMPYRPRSRLDRTATTTSASSTGFPFPVGAANIYRVPAAGGAPQVVASGFTHIVDLTFGPDGSLYVVEIAKNGLLAAFNDNDWTRRAHPHRPGRHGPSSCRAS